LLLGRTRTLSATDDAIFPIGDARKLQRKIAAVMVNMAHLSSSVGTKSKSPPLGNQQGKHETNKTIPLSCLPWSTGVSIAASRARNVADWHEPDQEDRPDDVDRCKQKCLAGWRSIRRECPSGINGFGVTAEIGRILSLAVSSAKCYLKSWAMLAIN
jgi:hypothetical protein